VSRPDGILLSGAGNIVSACVIANTAGNGISSSGANNLITRNHITNTDYAGTYSCAISLGGIGDAAIFNTAAQSGRDILHPGGGPGAAGGAPGANVQFNDLSFPGLLCKDLGVIYGAANSHIAFNWLHDNNYPGPTPLVYLDNWNYSNTVDHNVCWNNGGFPGITINSPAAGDRIYNNTVFNCAWSLAPGNNAWNTTNGAIGNPDPAFWTRYVDEYLAANNLFLSSSPQTELADWTRQKFQLLPGASAVDAGLVVPGVTDGYAGSAPDLGAYEQGAPPWTAGVDSRPTLTVSRAPDGSLVLGASPDAIFYSLYSTTNPAPPVVWTQVPGSPRISGPSWSFQLPAPNASTALYRLQSPWD